MSFQIIFWGEIK